MEDDKQTQKDELRQLLRAKIGEKRIQRSNKYAKERVLDKTLREIGLDKEKFKEDMERVKKQGGLQIDLKNL